jgi:hypothetical protein
MQVGHRGPLMPESGWQLLYRSRYPDEDRRCPLSVGLRSRTSESEAVPSLEMRHSERLKSMSPFLADEAPGGSCDRSRWGGVPASVQALRRRVVTRIATLE